MEVIIKSHSDSLEAVKKENKTLKEIIKSYSDSLEAVKNENKILKEKCDNAIKTKIP